MHLATLYSNSSNSKLGRPFIKLDFFPAPAEKYIILHSGGGNDKFPAKIYDLWQNVVNLTKPFLELHKIEIVQLGLANEKPINGAINLLGKTTIHQSSFLIKNSILLIGNDSSLAHIAGALNVDVAILYGPTGKPHEPFWHTKNSEFIHSHRNGRIPSFSSTEQNKTVNLIKPEYIARTIGKLLGFESKDRKISQETIYAGPFYCQGNSEIHVIPDSQNVPNLPPEAVPHLRGDLFFEPNIIFALLSRRKYLLHLSRALDSQQIEILKKLKQNVAGILFEVQDDTTVEFVKNLQKTGIPLNLWTQFPEDHDGMRKLEFLDLPIVNICTDTKTEEIQEKIRNYNNIPKEKFGKCPNCDDVGWYADRRALESEWEQVQCEWCYNTIPFSKFNQNNWKISYYSKTFYLAAGGKIFPSLYAYKNGISIENVEEKSPGDLKNQDFRDEFDKFLVEISPDESI